MITAIICIIVFIGIPLLTCNCIAHGMGTDLEDQR